MLQHKHSLVLLLTGACLLVSACGADTPPTNAPNPTAQPVTATSAASDDLGAAATTAPTAEPAVPTGAATEAVLSPPAAETEDTADQIALVSTAAATSTAPLPTATTVQTGARGLPLNTSGVEVVARVNGRDITLPEFQDALTRYQQQIVTEAADMAALEATVLDTLIEQKLIEQAAVALQIEVTNAEVEAEIANNIELAGGEDGWQEWLTVNGYSEEEYRETVYESFLTSRIRDTVTADIGENAMQVHARHILVSTAGEAESVLERLQNGEDFAALALELSGDVSTREVGGDLGWFTEAELLDPELGRVAFALEPGQIAGPVPSRLGFHVIQALERGERPVSPEVRFWLMRNQFERWLQAQQAAAQIERYL